MDEKLLMTIFNSMNMYVSIISDKGEVYSNLPLDFDVTNDENLYHDKYYERNDSKFTYGDTNYQIHSYKDVTSLKKAVNFDGKTGALSSVGFYKKAIETVKTNDNFVLGMLDVDNFKSFNDTYGHVIGDEVLSIIVHIFKHNVKSEDYIGRFGGDEFIFVMRHVDESIAKERLNEITTRLEKGIKLSNGKILPITLSVGIINYDYNETYQDNIKNADVLLYKSKGQGKNQITINEGRTK